MAHLTWFETTFTARPTHLLLALHGRGTNGHDLEPLAQALDLPQVRFIFPTAPLEMGSDAYQWYDFDHDSREIPDSSQQLHDLIAELRQQYGNLPVIILGFSQGAVLTLEAGLTLSPPPLALVALSGYLHRLPPLTRADLPIFIAHGTKDNVIPIQAGRATQAALQKVGLPVVYQEFPIGHGISTAVVGEVRQFLLRLLGTL